MSECTPQNGQLNGGIRSTNSRCTELSEKRGSRFRYDSIQVLCVSAFPIRILGSSLIRSRGELNLSMMLVDRLQQQVIKPILLPGLSRRQIAIEPGSEKRLNFLAESP